MLDKIICALDTSDIQLATQTVQRLSPSISRFKVGHSLTLAHGLDVIQRLQDAGAAHIFLDLKFHDIPNTVALAINEVSKRNVWMTTLHTAGGSEMMRAAADVPNRPLLMGVSVLTSLDQNALNEMGVTRSIEEQMLLLAQLGVASGLDGLISSPHEVPALRESLGQNPLIVTPGIRLDGGATHDQKRIATPQAAIEAGASYLVIGRALTDAQNIDEVVEKLTKTG
ncbi:MAG TPA: orotidine-5'-phosphate decarboxylase [Fimbriimonas sp.]|nr:orotidine-5'-phosphate decarboxylase [Fimbriimonas sp.]